MRASHWFATRVAGIVFLGLSTAGIPALAQGQFPSNTRPPAGFGQPTAPAQPAAAAPPAGGAPRGTNVAVVDVKFIFDNHVRFKAAMDGIKKEYEQFEAQVRDTETKLRKDLEQLKAMPAGSPEFKQLETSIATTRTQVQLDINRRQKERVDEEAKVYYNAYQEVEQEIGKFAARYGIDLVLQFSTAEIDPAKPDTVIRGLNRLVVYQNRLNITDSILQEINRGAPQISQQTVRPQPGVGQADPRGSVRQPAGGGFPTAPQKR